jgi:thioester reductase-like protein
MDTMLFTGFPGFLGRRVLPELLARSPTAHAICLVQTRFRGNAEAALASLAHTHPGIPRRVRLVEGDITEEGLGLSEGAMEECARADSIFHLAAVYDLSVGSPLAERVNVGGTRNVIEFARRCAGLRRLHYVSTCYVSGRYPGVFRAEQLEEGQKFNNPYEATKHRAEVEVRRASRAGIPVTIYRPSVVVGDSTDGQTEKFDGPYFFIRWVLKQGSVAVVPVVGRAREHRLNAVPVDFVSRAVGYLSALDPPTGTTYQLADPAPPTIDELITAIGEAAGKEMIRIPMPRGVATAALSRIPGLARWMGIPPATVDYFVHPTDYDTAAAQAALAGSGIEPPRLLDYLPALVDFTRRHPEIGSSPMV